MNHQRIGRFLKQLREEKGLTQEQLAEHFQVSSRTVSRWETGTNLPNIDTLIDLAAYYNAEVGEIIDGERKGEKMKDRSNDTMKKVAEYNTRWLIRQIISGAIKGILIFAVVYLILSI